MSKLFTTKGSLLWSSYLTIFDNLLSMLKGSATPKCLWIQLCCMSCHLMIIWLGSGHLYGPWHNVNMSKIMVSLQKLTRYATMFTQKSLLVYFTVGSHWFLMILNKELGKWRNDVEMMAKNLLNNSPRHMPPGTKTSKCDISRLIGFTKCVLGNIW